MLWVQGNQKSQGNHTIYERFTLSTANFRAVGFSPQQVFVCSCLTRQMINVPSHLVIGSITSRCSEKEPMLLPEVLLGEGRRRHERLVEIEPNLMPDNFITDNIKSFNQKFEVFFFRQIHDHLLWDFHTNSLFSALCLRPYRNRGRNVSCL